MRPINRDIRRAVPIIIPRDQFISLSTVIDPAYTLHRPEAGRWTEDRDLRYPVTIIITGDNSGGHIIRLKLDISHLHHSFIGPVYILGIGISGKIATIAGLRPDRSIFKVGADIQVVFSETVRATEAAPPVRTDNPDRRSGNNRAGIPVNYLAGYRKAFDYRRSRCDFRCWSSGVSGCRGNMRCRRR